MLREKDANGRGGRGTAARLPHKQRIQSACDACKKRKIRCDSGQIGNSCTRCTTLGLDCTHADLMKTLTSANGYVTALESRVEKMERLLTEERLLPGIDFAEQLENESEVQPLVRVDTLPRNDGDLADGLNKLKLNPENQRFFGKSSGIQFVQTAFNFQTHLTGIAISQMRHRMISAKRDQFWVPSPWLLPPVGEEAPQYTFPSAELLPVLVDKYFTEVNPFWPVLHRPTFERKVADKLHLRDHRFGSTLLMVCSLGARHLDDPQIDDENGSLYTAGWKWHRQVRVIPKHLIYKPDLHELQTVALSALYCRIISSTALCWTQVGFGLRRAQDVGAHRRRSQDHPTAESEQWKRVFWVLLCLERVTGTHIGRPLAMHYQDFDQELPVECDDESWDLPEPRNFKQPKDKPSVLSYFICYAKLLEIQASATTTLYSPRKPKDPSGHFVPPTEAQCIAAFDSALNAWLNDVPEHLRWDPARKNILHFKQSTLLYAAYYNVQILVHRPFIPAPFEASPPGALPSLAIASNAARNCAHIFDACEKRGILPYYENIVPIAFTAGIVLILSAWSGKTSTFTFKPSKELDLIQSCIRLTSKAENRYISAGRYTDLMNRLLHVGGSIDQLFVGMGSFPAPPPPQQAEISPLDRSSKFVPHHFEAASDHATLNTRRQPGSGLGAGVYTGFDSTFPTLTQICELDQLLDRPLNPDLLSFSPNMAADADLMAMWSPAPSGFQDDEWSHNIMFKDMFGPQFDQFSSVYGQTQTNTPRQAYLDSEEFEKLNRELHMYFEG